MDLILFVEIVVGCKSRPTTIYWDLSAANEILQIIIDNNTRTNKSTVSKLDSVTIPVSRNNRVYVLEDMYIYQVSTISLNHAWECPKIGFALWLTVSSSILVSAIEAGSVRTTSWNPCDRLALLGSRRRVACPSCRRCDTMMRLCVTLPSLTMRTIPCHSSIGTLVESVQSEMKWVFFRMTNLADDVLMDSQATLQEAGLRCYNFRAK